MNKRWLTLLVTALGSLILVAWAIWRAVRPGIDISKPVQVLAIKAAAGDTNAVVSLQSLASDPVPPLVQLLSSRDNFFHNAAWVLAPKLPRWLRQHWMARLHPLEAARYRAAAARALGLLGPKANSAVPALLNRLHDPQPYVAMEAATALSRIGEVSISGLIGALGRKDSVARHAAAYALGEMGAKAEQAIPSLIEKLEDADPQVRSSSAYSLTQIGYPAITAISNIIDHADPNAREAALKEFIRFYHSLRSIEPALVKMAHAEQPGSRRQAIEALGAIRAADDAAIGAMIGALRDPAPDVRLAALKALSLIPWRVSAAVNELPGCLRDPSPEVRAWAAKLLGTIGPVARPALPELERCVREDEVSVRAAAQEAIKKIAAPSASDIPAQTQ